MTRQLDKRDFSYEAVPEARGGGGALESADIPDLDPFTGSIRKVELDTAGFGEQSTRLKAMEAAREASVQASGFIDSEPAEFGLPQDVSTTSAGAEIVHLQQLHRGIPVFQSGRTVHFRPGGQAAVTGAAVEALSEAESEPSLDARSAVIAAAKYVAQADDEDSPEETDGFGSPRVEATIELPDDFQPVQTATFDLPAQPTTFVAEPFEGPIKASLVYLYMGPEVRLTWQVELVFPNAAADYVVLVAAGENNPGEILYAADRACHLLGVCEVHFHNPAQTARASANFPLPAGTLPGTLSQAPPAQHWIGDQPRTSGNNVVCRGEAQGVVNGVLDGDLVTFGPFQAASDEDHVAHTFYFCNVMHDFFEALGFDEAVGQLPAGQPQRRARGRGSRAGARLRRGSPRHRVDGHATRRSIAHDAHGPRREHESAHRAGFRCGVPRVRARRHQPAGRRAPRPDLAGTATKPRDGRGLERLLRAELSERQPRDRKSGHRRLGDRQSERASASFRTTTPFPTVSAHWGPDAIPAARTRSARSGARH